MLVPVVKTVNHTIYRDLRRDIITGRYPPGQRLEAGAIADEHGTSVSPVRDALQRLEQEGLVTIRPRAGYFVARMTLKQLTDLLDLREILEHAAIARAAQRISADQLAQLTSVHSGYTGDDPDSYHRYTDENRRFHVLLAQASGNQALAEAIGGVLDRLARFMVLRRGGQMQHDSHQRIIAALQVRDALAAEQRLHEELSRSRRKILDQVMAEAEERWTVG